MSEWIDINFLKPNHGQFVIAFIDGFFVNQAQYLDGCFIDIVKDEFGCLFETVSRDVTHWMPLPEPPQEQNND